MSLRVDGAGSIPEGTARVARAAFPAGGVALWLRDELGAFVRDSDQPPAPR